MGIDFKERTVTEITKDADGLLNASTELQTFMSRLQGVFRGVKFAKMMSNRVWFYYPDEPYPMGYIGYGDFRTEVDGDLSTWLLLARLPMRSMVTIRISSA